MADAAWIMVHVVNDDRSGVEPRIVQEVHIQQARVISAPDAFDTQFGAQVELLLANGTKLHITETAAQMLSLMAVKQAV